MLERVADRLVPPRARDRAADVCGVPAQTALALLILFSAAFVFYAWLWPAAPIRKPDSGSYLRTARAVAELRTDQPYERTVGYPMFLVLTGSQEMPGRPLFFASLLLHFLSIWLLAAVLHRCGATRGALLAFGVLLVLPPYVEPAGYVLTESLTEATLVIGFAALAFWAFHAGTSWLILGGTAISAAALTRPTYQLLAAAVIAYAVLARLAFASRALDRKRLAVAAAVVLGASVLIQGGNALLTARMTGGLGGNSILGFALTQKTLRVLERLPDEDAAVRDILIRARNAALLDDGRHTGSAYVEPAIPELMKVTGLDKAQLSKRLVRLNILLILKAPAEYLQEVVWAFGSYWFPASGELANLNSRVVQLVWALLQFAVAGWLACSLVLLIGGGSYLFTLLRRAGRSAGFGDDASTSFLVYGMAATFVFYSAAVSCVIQDGLPRYRVPTDGLILFMAFLAAPLWRRLVGAVEAPWADRISF